MASASVDLTKLICRRHNDSCCSSPSCSHLSTCFDRVVVGYDGNFVDGSENLNVRQQESSGLVPFKEKTNPNSNYGSAGVSVKDHTADGRRLTTPVVYSRRWLMLALFCFYSFSNSFQWINLNIISDILGRYYNQSLPRDSYQRNTAIDWLSMVYMLAYIPLILPVMWVLDQKGLRLCCLCGSLLNALGAWLKCASLTPDRFPLLMFAQTISAMAQVCVLGIPARLAAVWFGPNEVSTATSLGVFGNQVGIAAGFLLPPMMVTNSNDTDVIDVGLRIMYYGVASLTTVVFLSILVFFHDRPPQPPSKAQYLAVVAAASQNYKQSLVQLVTNKGFILLIIAYGINTGSFYAVSTLLNATVFCYFPGQGVSAGRIGLTIVAMGVLGSVLVGVWLDKTRTFRGTTVAVYILSLAGSIAFTAGLNLGSLWITFITAGSLGFFMTGYLPVGYEFAAELTFPESEATSSGLLNISAQVFGVTLTLTMRAMLESVSVLSANAALCALLFVGCILTGLSNKQLVSECRHKCLNKKSKKRKFVHTP
ncbi:unnamed protein product [Candidula unifasciata]|uniref:Choline/ethanolamine transporter FLVCR1 n=1 Tax=Candidula unifasciata TaxID=100452 RepID=A0A8S3ZXI4_9EUPU|nr:unnamed protein product [Candidula unifasciata]